MRNISLRLPTCSCINQRSFRGNRRLVSLRCGFSDSVILSPPRFLIRSQQQFPSPSHRPKLMQTLAEFFPATDMDNSPTSVLRYRRVFCRENHPLARGRLLSFNCWYSTLDRAGRLSSLYNGWILGKNKILLADSRRDGRIQLPHPGLGQGSLGRHRRQGGRHYHRFCRAELFPAKPRCCC